MPCESTHIPQRVSLFTVYKAYILHLLLLITKKYAYICAKNVINNAQVHSFSSASIH